MQRVTGTKRVNERINCLNDGDRKKNFQNFLCANYQRVRSQKIVSMQDGLKLRINQVAEFYSSKSTSLLFAGT